MPLLSTELKFITMAQSQLVSIPTPSSCLSSRLTAEKDLAQPLSRCLFPEPELCLEVGPSISSWYHLTSCTSDSFPTREVTCHVPKPNSATKVLSSGPLLRLPLIVHCMGSPNLILPLQLVRPQVPLLHRGWCQSRTPIGNCFFSFFWPSPTLPHGPEPVNNKCRII